MSEEQFLRTLARYDGDIKRGALKFDYRTGACGPVQATQVRSWGAACPTGFCAPDNLPEALGRWFAGDRAGCREIPYTIRIDGTSDAALDVNVVATPNATVTMCPTRIITHAVGNWNLNVLQFGSVNQIFGGPIPHTSLGTQVHASVPMVPDCIRAGQPIRIDADLLPDGVGGAADSLWIVFLGPMVG